MFHGASRAGLSAKGAAMLGWTDVAKYNCAKMLDLLENKR
jgi:hypothetical protein